MNRLRKRVMSISGSRCRATADRCERWAMGVPADALGDFSQLLHPAGLTGNETKGVWRLLAVTSDK